MTAIRGSFTAQSWGLLDGDVGFPKKVVKTHIKSAIFTISKCTVQNVNYVYIVVQEISRTFPFCKTEISHSMLPAWASQVA